MSKIARKISQDPEQDELRQNKTDWNIKVTKFIATLIALKKAINGQAVPALGIDKSSIKEPLPDKIPQLLNYLSSQYEEATEEALRLIEEQKSYSEHKLNILEANASNPVLKSKNASNMLSRLLFYSKTPFDFSKSDRWHRQKLLRSAAKLYDLISDIEEDILTRKNKSIPEAIFNSKIFIHNFINDISKPLYKMYENENSHLLNIINEINVKVKYVEEYIKTTLIDETNIELIQSLKSLINKYKLLLSKQRLAEAIDAYSEIEEMINVFSKQAGKVDRWMLRKYLKVFNKEDSSLRLASADSASKIRKSLNLFMNLIQSNDDVVSLSSELFNTINYIFQFIEGLEQLADLHNNMMNLEKNDAGKYQGMMVPVRDITFLKNIKRELADSLIKFRNISGAS